MLHTLVHQGVVRMCMVVCLRIFYPIPTFLQRGAISTAPSSWSAQTHQHESGRGKLLHLANHSYLVESMDPTALANIINNLLADTP